jgi:hypothetical protein
MAEIVDAGYGGCDEKQGRDECNRFTPLNYVIRDIPLFQSIQLRRLRSRSALSRCA